MKQTKFSGRHVGFLVAAFAMVASLATPLTTAFAATATDRSVTVSSSSIDATGVQYKVAFTTGTTAAGAVVVYFCGESPLIGQTCTRPTDFDATAATVVNSPGFTLSGTAANNRVQATGTIAAEDEIEITFGNITNPSVAGTMYVRVVTYAEASQATAATATTLGAGVVDEGSMAVAITPTIGVSGIVLETLTFCVSGSADGDPEVNPIGDGCTGTLTSASVELGDDVSGLTAGTIHSGKIYTQISTNAVNGATVRLKSSTTSCGGLLRAGAATPAEGCNIAPALNTGLSGIDNSAKFGVMSAAITDGTGANGVYAPVDGTYYDTDPMAYAMNYVAGNTEGVTSPFGDPFLDTASLPANNKNRVLTFGATAGNNTPAGSYSADISLIAVGKF